MAVPLFFQPRPEAETLRSLAVLRLGGETDAIEARQTRSFHDIDYGLVRGLGISINHNHRVGAITGRTAQRLSSMCPHRDWPMVRD